MVASEHSDENVGRSPSGRRAAPVDGGGVVRVRSTARRAKDEMSAPVTILLISGSTRRGSTNTAVLRTAQEVQPDGVTTARPELLATLPAFNPDDDHEPLHPAVAELRQAIADAAAVLFCTPEYAGALPGSFKNLLDWTVGGGEMYRKPVGWINVSSVAAPTGGADAHASLAKVLGYVGADAVEQACVRLPLSRDAVDSNSLIADPHVRRQIAAVLGRLRQHALDGSGVN
jgi:chromate reductase, NAD(P)H dehydrogenase (quinone)